MVDPTPVEEGNASTSADADADAQAIFLAQQAQEIELARSQGNGERLRTLELYRQNEDRGIYQNEATGQRVTVFDGDSKSILPILENQHAGNLKNYGGVDAFVEHMSAQFKPSIESGKMNQAVADMEIELLQAAGTDSAKYAQLRFESNGFFAEQAEKIGLDSARANDIFVTVVDAGTSLDGSNAIDLDTMVKIADGNQLTEAGRPIVLALADAAKPKPTLEEVEARAMDISFHTMNTNPKHLAAVSAIGAIIEPLAAQMRAKEITTEQYHASRVEQKTEVLFEQLQSMNDQIQNDARLSAARELGVNVSEMYPELVAAENLRNQQAVAGNDGTTVSSNDIPLEIPIETETVDVDASSDGPMNEDATDGQTIEDATVSYLDKGYVTNPDGGPVTFEVESPEKGQPIRNSEGPLYGFQGGTNLTSGFEDVSDPGLDKIAMVDSFQRAFDALDVINHENADNNLGNMTA